MPNKYKVHADCLIQQRHQSRQRFGRARHESLFHVLSSRRNKAEQLPHQLITESKSTDKGASA